jgi:Glycosyltransferase family 87
MSSESPSRLGFLHSLTTPVEIGARRLPPLGLVLLAAVGCLLLVVVATTAWQLPTDEHAYWLAAQRFAAGGSMYDPTTVPGDTGYGYYYPPPLAQVLAPLTSLISSDAYSVLWTIVLLACLWWLGGRDPLTALALIAFLPVAVELRARNIHLVLAVLAVLALRRSALFWVPATAIKVSPVLGIAYLLAARRWRDALVVALVGGAVLAVSFALAPGAWRDFFDIVVVRAGSSVASILPLAFPIRLAGGLALAVLGGVAAASGRPRIAEPMLICGIVLANPTLWVTALSMLIAIVPLWRTASGIAWKRAATQLEAATP